MAEHALALMFALTKRTPPRTARCAPAISRLNMRGDCGSYRVLCGGVVGFGAIGRATAALARGLDVFQREPVLPDNPLLGLPNVVLTPHIAASTEQAMTRMANAAVDGVLRVLAGEPPASLVNPDVWPRRRRRKD
ncbi:NAD(P)-dependent oxidoreductase [Sodalis glossinidius]|uniref:NAD(P)-dependent oxidoreductase n=1 Tax=Sodalis glossinidius TaxID=63612 RepID=UPI001FB13CBE|nr:NAD(P)-dependent oxidoreductase [Sodalis glossinidius]